MTPEERQQIEDILSDVVKRNIYLSTAMEQIEALWNKSKEQK
jgi:hypothetical protein